MKYKYLILLSAVFLLVFTTWSGVFGQEPQPRAGEAVEADVSSSFT